MKKFFTLSLVLLTAVGMNAQKLASKIPPDAPAVVTIKGGNITELISASEFSETEIGRSILKKLSEKSSQDFTNMKDFGIQLEAKSYYFYKRTDSISYHCLWLPLENGVKFGNLFKKKSGNTEQTDGFTIIKDSTNNVIIWDDKKALLLFGDIESYYFDDTKVEERYGIPNGYNGPAGVAYAQTAYAARDAAANTYAETPSIVEETSIKEAIPCDSVIEVQEVEIEALPEDNRLDYYERKEIKDRILAKLAIEWTYLAAKNIFQMTPENSILENASYLKSLDPKAEVSIWVSNPYSLLGINNYNSELMLVNRYLKGLKSMNAHLYVEDDQIKVKTTVGLSDELAKSYQKIYDAKINRKFLKYIDSEKALGFMGYAINTEAYLKELPKIVVNSYPTYLWGLYKHQETVDFVIDLLSVMLDEEAIAEVIKGDALLVLNGVTEKEVTYTEYEYDKSYRLTSVQKTKTETIPDFLFMLSSDNTELVEKLLAVALKEENVTKKDGIYYLEDTKDYFTFHILLKDGIVFVGTSADEITKIKNGTFEGNVSRKHRKLIRRNAFMASFNSVNVYNAIPEEDLLMFSKKNPYISNLKDMGDWSLKSEGVKGNAFSAELTVKTPDDQENAMKYLLGLLGEMAK